MQRVWTVVDRQVIRLAVQFKRPLRDAISVPAHNCTEIRVVRLIPRQVIETKCNIPNLAVSIRAADRLYARSVSDDVDFNAR